MFPWLCISSALRAPLCHLWALNHPGLNLLVPLLSDVRAVSARRTFQGQQLVGAGGRAGGLVVAFP